MNRNQIEQIVAISNIVDGIIVTDMNAIVVYYSNFRPDVNDLREQEVIGRSIFEIHRNLKPSESSIMRVINTGVPIFNELQILGAYNRKPIKAFNTTLPIHEEGKMVGVVEFSTYQAYPYERQKITIVPQNEKKVGARLYTIDDIITVSHTLEDINVNDQKLFLTVMTVVHTADSKKQLDIDTETIRALARDVNCGLSVLKFQQYDGMVTAIPYGHRKVDVFRTFNTQSVAIFMPFRVQEVRDNHGIYYGQNAISNNMIIIDRHELINGNSIIGGVPGSGKSFIAKNELINIALANPNVDLFVIDPEREYGQLIRALGGEVIEISATSDNHINALDISRNYGERDPIIEKSEFIQSLCEQIISGHRFSRGQQSIIDRCTDIVLRPYIRGNYVGDNPTLKDFREELLRQPEKEAKALALELELFTTGSLDTFAKQTNVDINNRLICYDINELGEQLKAAGMLVILDSILNRITENRAKGRETYIFIDELYLLFMHQYSSQFLFKLWKRVRKYGAYCIGITQNIEDMLQSHNARTMLSNSEFVIMLNQAASDRIELAKLLNISNEQLSHITNAEPGHGLIKVGSNLVPFANDFPKNTKLYRLMSTKPGERFEGDE